jgi:hypothetical protein
VIHAALGLSLLLATPSRTSFPGGSVAIPEGCSAPAEITMGIDSWMGSIDCPNGLGILVFGSAMAAKACPEANAGQRPGLSLSTAGGERIEVCPSDVPTDSSRAVRLVMAVGGTAFITQVQRPSDVLLVLSIVASFEPKVRR